MISLSAYKITIENPKGSYKSLESENDTTESTYPLKGIVYPVDYGCIDNYIGEDGDELDIFVGAGDQSGYITVWRLDVPTETKFFANLAKEELKSVLEAFQPVLIDCKVLNDVDFVSKIESFKKQI